eukprot:6206138-Pleurochrysis_carterae.AAC.1
MVPYVTNRGGPLIGPEVLSLQGIPVDDLCDRRRERPLQRHTTFSPCAPPCLACSRPLPVSSFPLSFLLPPSYPDTLARSLLFLCRVSLSKPS